MVAAVVFSGMPHDDVVKQEGADIASLAAVMQRPLRPMWISQMTRIWLNEEFDTSSLGFTPVVLISASLPNARQACTTGEGVQLPLHIATDLALAMYCR